MQELYEKKMVTYPRTDARVLSTAVAKEIHKNIGGLKNCLRLLPESPAYFSSPHPLWELLNPLSPPCGRHKRPSNIPLPTAPWGIGTSATRAEILKKLVNIEYLALNKKTQVLTPTLMGEMIYDVVRGSNFYYFL